MKHNVIFQGKNYISSKRASKISDYSSDYIGQLCRAGKLDARMVGHSWFVTEESLLAHKKNVIASEGLRDRAQNFSHNSKGNVVAEAGLISAKEAAQMTGYSADYVSQLCRARKVDAKMIGNSWFIVRDSLHAYVRKIHDDERAAELRKLSKRAYTSCKKLTGVEHASEVAAGSVNGRRVESPIRSLRNTVYTLVVVAVLIGAVSLSLVYVSGSANVAVNRSSVASVYSAVHLMAEFLRREYAAFLAFIADSRRELTTRTNPGSAEISGQRYGVAVAPSTGSADRDAEFTEQVRNTFSDQVNVRPDASGTAGVVTPVFRKTNGTDFMYVLVPVNEQKANAP